MYLPGTGAGLEGLYVTQVRSLVRFSGGRNRAFTSSNAPLLKTPW